MKKLSNIITLTTDFGFIDPFVGTMKGAMLNINNKLRFVDISHMIEPQNIVQASYVLQQSFKYFPSETIHTVVVDPGVGTARRALIVQTEEYYFIAPDNGVLTSVFNSSKLKKVIEITEKKYFLPSVSCTFHGRDIFAPVSAWISKGEDIKNFGKEISDHKILDTEEVKMVDTNTIRGKIVYKDRFGNITTNISEKFTLEKNDVTITLTNLTINGICGTYAESNGEPSALINSWGMLEIFLPNADASSELNLEIGAEVVLTWK